MTKIRKARACSSYDLHTLKRVVERTADVWGVSSYNLLDLKSAFTDWITIDLTEFDARSGEAAGAPDGDANQQSNRMSAAINNGLDKWFASGKVAVGMLGGKRCVHGHVALPNSVRLKK
jgi:hypothetical protein